MIYEVPVPIEFTGRHFGYNKMHGFLFLSKSRNDLYLAALKTNHREIKDKLQQLNQQLEGDLFFDDTMRLLYATDASAYRELPLAVAIPKSEDDLKRLIQFARKEKT